MRGGPDDAATTRLGFLSGIGRRAVETVTRPGETLEEAPGLPPLGTVIEPYRSGRELLEDVAAPTQGVRVWWLGQSGFLLKSAEEHLLIDPYLSDALAARSSVAGREYDRLTRLVVEPGHLAFVLAVVCTNGNPDHLDPGTLPDVLAGGARLVCPSGSEILAGNLLGRVPDDVLGAGDRLSIGGFRVEAVPAFHDSAPEGVGYIVRAGGVTLYHAGDTAYRRELAAAVRPHRPDLAIVPVNGRQGNMSGSEAARLGRESGARLVLPCHYEMFRIDTASPARFIAQCVRLRQEYRLLRAGESLTLAPAG